MRRICARLSFFLLLLSSMLVGAAETELKSWAYVAHWMGDTWRESRIEALDRLLFFEIKIDANGRVAEANGWPEQWQSLKSAAMAANRPLDLVLTMFSVDAFNQLFSSSEAMHQFRDTALSLADEPGIAGLHLDVEVYEGSKAVALTNYQHFVKELSTELGRKSPARQLSVFYPMGGSLPLYEPATLRHLGAVVFQGYDAHWPGGHQAGPVAPLRGAFPLTWEQIYALSQMLDLNGVQTLISFPLFGYEWPVKNQALHGVTKGVGTTTTFAPVSKDLLPNIQINIASRLANYGAVHDPVSGSAYYKYSPRKGEWIEGWFEDWWTLGQKMDFLCEKQIAGVAFFPLGYDRNDLISFYQHRRFCQN